MEAHEEAVDRRQQQRRCGRVEDRRARCRVIRVVVAEPLQHRCDLPQHRLIVWDGPHGRTGRAASEGAAGDTRASNVQHAWSCSVPRGEQLKWKSEPLHLSETDAATPPSADVAGSSVAGCSKFLGVNTGKTWFSRHTRHDTPPQPQPASPRVGTWEPGGEGNSLR